MIAKFYSCSEISVDAKPTIIPNLLVFKKSILIKEVEPYPIPDKDTLRFFPIKNMLKQQEDQGFVQKDRMSCQFPDFQIEKDCEYILVTSEFIDWCGKHRYFQSGHEDIERLNKRCISSKPFDDLQNSKYQLIKLSWHDHSLFDAQNKPIVQPIYFDYMNGNIDNSCYDLNKVLNLLLKRKDIIPQKFEEIKIKGVPGYNCTKNRNQYISFIWLPSKEAYEMMYVRYLKENREINGKYKAIFDLDLLGLRVAAKYDNFYASDDYPGD